MGLSIILNKQHSRDWYTSLDEICGSVTLTSKHPTSITRILVYLEATVKTHVPSYNTTQDSLSRSSKHTVLSRQSVLYSASDHSLPNGSESVGPGTSEFPFVLTIPLFTDRCQQNAYESHALSTLPPTLQLTSTALKITIAYSIHAIAERPGKLKKNLNASHEFHFQPLDPPRLDVIAPADELKAYGYITAESLGIREQPRGNDQELPPYNSSLGLEISTWSGSVRPGDHVDLSISVSIPDNIQKRLGDLWLSSLVVKLVATTTATVDTHQCSHETSTQIVAMHGFLPLDRAGEGESFPIGPGLWRHHVYPMILPSFKTCGLERRHRLEVIAAIGSGMTQQVHNVAASVCIRVESCVAACSSVSFPEVLATGVDETQ